MSYSYIAATALGRIEVLQGEAPAELGTDQVLIKVEYSSLMPYDLYQLDQGFAIQKYPSALGINASGTISKVGSGVSDLKIGDRVTALTVGSAESAGKGLQGYTAQPRALVSKIPDTLSFEAAATLPDNFVTAFYTLFDQLGLPWNVEDFPPKDAPANAGRPVLVYGGGATSGQYIVQLLKLAKYTNIIVAASPKHNDFLQAIGATHVVDYRSTSFVEDVAKAVGGDGKVEIVVDVVFMNASSLAISKVLRSGGTVASLVPYKQGNTMSGGQGEVFGGDVPADVISRFDGSTLIPIVAMKFQQNERFSKTVFPIILARLLEGGSLRPNDVIVLDKGTLLDRAHIAFDLLRENNTGGKKVVIKVD